MCIGCVVYLFNDVNNTFDHVMDEMKEFKHYSNNAWGQMTDITVFGKNSIFGRVKRGGGCACGAQAASCPPGLVFQHIDKLIFIENIIQNLS